MEEAAQAGIQSQIKPTANLKANLGHGWNHDLCRGWSHDLSWPWP